MEYHGRPKQRINPNMTELEATLAAPPPPQLLSIELRIVGALMEKQLTTPDQYPLTLNSLIAACNQKSSRDPVSNYTQGEIARALQELQHKRFVNKEYGSRADKFSQTFIKHLELGRKHQALLCVMMLRGPQTISELSTRTQRMVQFTDKDDLEHTLDRLCNREIPYTARLSQQPGQRGERFTHLFSGKPTDSIAAHSEDQTDTRPRSAPDTVESLDTPSPDATSVKQIATSEDTESLHREFDSMKQEIKLLRQQIARLYRLTGHELDQESAR